MAVSLAGGNPICRKENCSGFDLGLVYTEIRGYSDVGEKFELKKIKNLASRGNLDQICQSDTFGSFIPNILMVVYTICHISMVLLSCCCFGVECGKNATKLEKLFKSPD